MRHALRLIDSASLATFRILFGCLMCWSTVRYLVAGKVSRYYVEPEFHFKYFGFEWVHALPEAGLIALFLAMAILAAMIAVGAQEIHFQRDNPKGVATLIVNNDARLGLVSWSE